jgi:hypothetical protein
MWVVLYIVTRFYKGFIVSQMARTDAKDAIRLFQEYTQAAGCGLGTLNPHVSAERLAQGDYQMAISGDVGVHAWKVTIAKPDGDMVLIRPMIERWLETLDKSKPQPNLIRDMAAIFDLTPDAAQRILDEINLEQAG